MTDEYGDFPTPPALAAEVCRTLIARGVAPASVVEPTCGAGNFALAALDAFPNAEVSGFEINPDHVGRLSAILSARGVDGARARVSRRDFFGVDWPSTFGGLPGPTLVLGNPPWVTNSGLGAPGGANLPEKSNSRGLSGLDALTGKSNFDVSEWMLTRLLEALAGRDSWLAMLCKTAVARKVLTRAWADALGVEWAEIRAIDAEGSFGAAVEACLLIVRLGPGGRSGESRVFSGLGAAEPSGVIGLRDGLLIADIPAYDRRKHLMGQCPYRWRSGVKHDCSRVMELRAEAGGYRNGLGEFVALEDDCVYPMLKGSEIAGGDVDDPTRRMLVPQRGLGDDTGVIRATAPKTWEYLERHGAALDRRRSSIYRGRPRFAVFGVGEYTFAPWKVAISGFSKRLEFRVLGSPGGKPTVLDDTAAFVACRDAAEAGFAASLLNSEMSRDFFSAFLFRDAKRPITVELLRRLDLRALARASGRGDEWGRLSLGEGPPE